MILSKSFVKTWSTIQTDGLFLMGFHFPSILERAAAWLKYNRLHKMFYLPCEAAATLTSLRTFTLQTFSNVTSFPPSRRWKPTALTTVGCLDSTFFFRWQAQHSVWMCLPDAAACWGPEWGAFCLIVIRLYLLLFSGCVPDRLCGANVFIPLSSD